MSLVRSPTTISVLVSTALLAAVVLFHPSDQMEAVRRLFGLGAERLAPPPDASGAHGSYSFSMRQANDSDPVAWDPCKPVAYAINPDGMPTGTARLIEAAVAEMSSATGLLFDPQPFTHRRPFTGNTVPRGRREAVVIGFGDESEFPGLAGRVAGIGGAAVERGVTGRLHYVTGGVVLDTTVYTATAISERPEEMRAIVLHELGHVVGLRHVEDVLELMARENSGVLHLGPGDREGLAQLGTAPCG